jgi:hypothetical protein
LEVVKNLLAFIHGGRVVDNKKIPDLLMVADKVRL